MSDGSEDEEEVYPPWLDPIINGDFDDEVEVLALDQKDDESQPGYVRCAEIRVPDTPDAAAGVKGSRLRRHTIKKYSYVLITAAPTEPPYVGLVEKIWRKADAPPVSPAKPTTFHANAFYLECYWFYRPREVEAQGAAWGEHMQQPALSGARFRYTSRTAERREAVSERQLLFSSHHTRHDYPGDDGRLSLEGFLQPATIYWLPDPGDPLPQRCSIRGSRLVRTREPGFIVRGFLWCGNKKQEQLAPGNKRAFPLAGDWGDKSTLKIVKKLVARSRAELKELQEHNDAVLARYRQAKAAGEQSIASDGGDDWKAVGQARWEAEAGGAADPAGAAGGFGAAAAGAAGAGAPAQRVAPPSPRLPGTDDGGVSWPGHSGRQQQQQEQPGLQRRRVGLDDDED